MAPTRKQAHNVFIPLDKPGWRELECHNGTVPRAVPAPGIDAHAAGALRSWNDGAPARQGVQA